MRLATTTADFLSYVNSPAEAVRAYEGTGFRYLDYSFYSVIYPGSPFLTDDWLREVMDAREAAEKLGFRFVQAHSPDYDPLNPTVDHEAGMLATRRSIEACHYLGVKNIVVHPGIGYRYPQERDMWFEKNLAYYRRLYPLMEKYDINVLIENGAENNVGDRCDFMTSSDMVEFVALANHPNLQICWDVGHANLRNTNQHDDILRMKDHLRALHIQDNYGKYDEHFAPFMGTINMDAIIQGLLEANYQGYFTFESGNILMAAGSVPHARYTFMGNMPSRLMSPSLDLKRKAVALMYEIGKYMLEQYNCFEV